MLSQITENVIASNDCVAIRLHGKEPFEKNWTARTESVPSEQFQDHDNVGLILGVASGGIVDVDIDDNIALQLADYFLPLTNAEFGRASKPRAHRLYKASESGRTSQYKWPDGGMIIELRATGSQTMIPPSRHPSGEIVSFEPAYDGGLITSVDWNLLTRGVMQVAIASVIKPFWRIGNRHHLALALSGVLRRASWTKADALDFIKRLCTAFNDEEPDDRLSCVESTFGTSKLINGAHGFGRLVGDKAARQIHKWLTVDRLPTTVRQAQQAESTDAECAESFSTHHQDDLFYDSAHKAWFLRERGTFRPTTDITVQRLIREHGESLRQNGELRDVTRFQSSHGIKAILNVSKTYLERGNDEFDSNDTLLGCENGVLNLDQHELLQNIDDVITHRVDTIYDPLATCPRFIQFLNEIFPNDEVISFVQRCMGYTLQGGVQEQCLFICVGNGKNGKTTLMQVMTRLMGTYAGTLPISTLMQSKYPQQNYDIVSLLGKRFVACSEGEAGEKLAEAKVKWLTGGDQISARQIYQAQITFMPTHKLWLTTNEMPNVEGAGDAIWRRLKCIIRFPVTIADDEVDPDLTQKLYAELSGILNFALKGYQEWKRIGLEPPKAIQQEYKAYRKECDTVGMFIETQCEIDTIARETARGLYRRYEKCCMDAELSPLSQKAFANVLRLKGFTSKRLRDGIMWQGLRLASELQENDQLSELIDLRSFRDFDD